MGDTRDIIDAAGGDATEVYPWDIEDIDRELSKGGYDGLVLTGGSDIDPRLYRAKPHKEVYGVDQLRDTCEYLALDHALDMGIPVLGICRGSQIMCAYRGGKLTQHIEGHRGKDHPVFATPDASTFKRAIGGREMEVVSLHHQCVRRPGKGMRIAARAYDKTPEAIESKDGLWLGVQFHPEMAAFQNGNAFAIFQWLVRKAAEHAGVRANVPTFREAKRPVRRTWRYTGTSCATPKPKNRPAGQPTFSARESARVFIESSASELELHTCPECGLLCDDVRDRDDHLRYLHQIEPWDYSEPFPGHGDWEEEICALDDDEIRAALRNIR